MFGRPFTARAEPCPWARPEQISFVEPQEARAWLDAGEAVLVDVREPPEHAAERVPGALFNPLSAFDPAQVPADGRKLVLHCRSGVRCGMAAERLVQAGYTGPIHRLQGGILAWKAAGLPVEEG